MYMPKILKKEGKNYKMEAILYITIFIMGALFGSFSTLAVYRIPIGEDIVTKHSFCPNCKAELQFKDLIPILSYIFLGGKCAYCGEKIRARYLVIEVLSGIVFVLFAMSIKFTVNEINIDKIIYLCFYLLYLVSLFIIAGIDREKVNIQRALLLFGFVVASSFMTYVCVHNIEAIYTYIIYLLVTVVLLVGDTIYTKRKMTQNYTIGCLMLVLYMMVFSGAVVSYMTVLFAFLSIVLKMTYIMTTKRAKKNTNLPVGFYLCVGNILLLLINNFIIK